ncbi:hypothetical protein GCG54_00005075 [Colletotrichum gloeosporioides]|uniref:Nucleoside phosphorylase domain-containing protein n=1 Tax=Colletotrichum gloeosporioides TaxID=474922 RepID=A0A8H4FKJ6_COLGL|nr:uncharacterized protein GCG54_00005075 [Colletotrichum gloeosporioides]KAF3805713.1 hypothetical protein GCG54_00005075 [Colletotrichum gloeosporioides]
MTSRRSPPEDFSRDPKRQRTFHYAPGTSHELPCNASPKPHEKYTVAWICALHIEMTAAEAMLDELHDTLPTHVDDNNTYTLGRIHKHNVVISCLPTGYYGTINAATVISNLKRSFPSIRAGLMVGIGGGVPSKADLRLGDVVVGTRVMQCDMGKIVENGQLQRTAIARIPHQLLCTAVSALRAKQERDGTSITSIVAQKFVGHSGYHRPDLSDDLFPPTYDHESSNIFCNQCDHTKLVPRRQRSDPNIHYGAIASGNQVMRSAFQRDIIGQELDVICFEMEAAGLMDILPCLPIRGICDYSDSHKNKSWQRYAAATAAAFATELLAVLPSSEARERLELPSRTGPPDDYCQQLLELLNFDQKDSRQSSIKTAHAKTCRWLLTHADYEAWLDPKRLIQHHGFLWIRGKPGAGKSTLMKFAYGNMRKARRRHGTTAAFFFNARGDYMERSVPGMYRSLLLQLLQGVPEVQSVVDNPDFEYEDLNECLQLDHLKELFWSAVLALGQQHSFTCFIDALDECDEQQVMDMVRFFEDLAIQTTEKNVKFRICFSSRHYPYIFVPESIDLVLEHQPGHTEDLATFVDSRLRIRDSALRSQLQPDILQKASGVFLWVSLVVDILNDQYARGGMDLRKRLKEIPDDLHALFKDMLRRDEHNKESLLLCILWILCAKRPLDPSEFSHALWSGLLMNGQADEEPPNLTRADGSSAADRFVIGSSKGLAEVTKARQPRVQFIHESVRDFLLKSGGLRELWPDLGYDWQIQAHERLKECCSYYLEYNPVQTFKHNTRRYRATANFLYILADKGFPNLILRWLEDNPQTDIFDEKERFRYPLFAALANGNKSSVAALLGISTIIQDGVDITAGLSHIKDLTNFIGRTPLSWACQEGRRGIASFLLQNGASASGKDPEGRTALSRASESDQDAVIEMLIEYGADVNSTERVGGQFYVPILLASKEATIQRLLEQGADPNTRTMNCSTIIHHMARRGNDTGIRAVISQVKGMIDDVNATNNDGSTPLIEATTGGHEAVAKLLIQLGADVNIGRTTVGHTALIEAITYNNLKLVELYIRHDADLSARCPDGHAPILRAFMLKRWEVIELLFNAGVDLLAAISGDPEVWEVHQDDILMWASQFGHASIVEFLFRGYSKCHISSETKDAALKIALSQDFIIVVGVLRVFGAVEDRS